MITPTVGIKSQLERTSTQRRMPGIKSRNQRQIYPHETYTRRQTKTIRFIKINPIFKLEKD